MPQNNGFFSNFFGGGNSNGGAPTSGDPNNGNGAPASSAGYNQDPSAQGGQGQGQGQQPGGQQPNGQQSGQDPNNPNGEGQGGQTNPLDIYNKMFENQESGDDDAPPSLALGKDTLEKVTGQLDFTSGIDQATLDQLQQGDLSSLPTLLNNVAKQVYQTAMQHNAALTNEFVGQRSKYDSERIAPTVKSTLTEARINDDLGDLSNQPAMKAQMTETAQRLAKAYPDATPEWIAAQAKQYVIQSASQLLGISPEDLQKFQSNQQQQAQQARDVDWASYFNQPTGSN